MPLNKTAVRTGELSLECDTEHQLHPVLKDCTDVEMIDDCVES